ncbi:response regulator [Haloarculaceae archaeon H-GB2-1]|nr:response regulator [Haloarculaceae archaeon H-GB1-1]MEA5387872.1 response regulator [Haloarculaceae archaeon H-GB11]MEA5409366.1 response regulator [Haloarculaceae archaeon H-GB2-1]
MTTSGSPPVVLVVEDQRELADLFTLWLSDDYEVRTAYSGEEALEAMDDTVAVVLLDRRLPGLSGDEFLDRIRSDGSDARVAMVSAVDPDFDIVEMGFDDYVTKPVEKDDLRAVVERLLGVDAAGPDTREYFANAAKVTALEAEKTDAELAESEEYASLLASIDAFKNRVIRLAERYLESPETAPSLEGTHVYEQEIEQWEARTETLDESDPLYQTAAAEVEAYERLLATETDENDVEQALLEVVADGFVAEGFWLDERILRALNSILYDKYTDVFVVNRRPLEPGRDLPSGKLVAVSQAVRDLAAAELSE